MKEKELEEKEPEQEEDCKPLTDEEYAEYLKNEKRKEKKWGNIFSAIWQVIESFFT